MPSAPVHHLTFRAPQPAGPPVPPAVDHPAGPRPDAVTAVPVDASTVVRVVPPGDVPDGAVILGHLVAVPVASGPSAGWPASGAGPAEPVRQLVAVPDHPRDAATATAVPTPSPGRSGPALAGTGLVLDATGRRAHLEGAELALTRREFDLLEHLVSHPGRVFSREQLLDAVWDLPCGYPGAAPRRSVDVHVSRLRRKLGRHADALQSLRGVGYRWSPRARDGQP